MNEKIGLTDKSIFPDEKVLRDILDNSYDLYLELTNFQNENNLSHEWRFYNDGKAWLCKIFNGKKKTLGWLSAYDGYYKIVVYIPISLKDKIVYLDEEKKIKEIIDNAKTVGKSLACIVDVKTADDNINVLHLLNIKRRM